MSAVSDNPTPVCRNVGQTTYVALSPGRYTNVATLNTPCPSPGLNTFMWLSPGTYYFDFGTTKWAWPNTLLGGTPVDAGGNAIAGLKANDATTLNLLANVPMQNSQLTPKSCASPLNANVSGVALVFGGASSVSANSSGSAGLCASSPTSSPPVAIYGSPTALTVPKTGGGTATIPAETLCASTCGSSSLISTDPSGQPTLYFNGYVYAPNVQIALSLKNSPGQVFNWGVVVRDFSLGVNGASPTAPFISLPKPNTGVGVTVTTSTPPPFSTTSVTQPPPTNIQHYTIRYVNVWTCTVRSLQESGQQHCPATGTPNVQARVLFDPANPTSTLQVLNWNSVH